MEKSVEIKMLLDAGVPEPRCAYDGTSAAFDIACSETTMIPAGKSALVPTGIKLSIDQSEPYYMQIHLRSSLGFKKDLRCHIGIVDAGYTGDFGVKVVNNTDWDVEIKKGEYFAQVLVLQKPKIHFKPLTPQEWQDYETQQLRGSGGFGSSNVQNSK